MQQIPWALTILHQIPGAAKAVNRLRDLCYTAAKKRHINGSQTKDVYYHLVSQVTVIHFLC